MHVLNFTRDLNRPMWNYIEQIMDTDVLLQKSSPTSKNLIKD